MDSKSNKLFTEVKDLVRLFDTSLVFIGGVAVYLHALQHVSTSPLAGVLHDADFYISLAALADLRDIEQVTANTRSNKNQMVKGGFEFDIYVENKTTLRVKYDELQAHSVNIGGISVACLEHLLCLKLDAYSDRCASTKGIKDERDLIRISEIAAAQHFDFNLAAQYLTDDHIHLLNRVKTSQSFNQLTQRNAQKTKAMLSRYNQFVQNLHTLPTNSLDFA